MSLLEKVTPDVRRVDILRQAAIQFVRYGDMTREQVADFMRLAEAAVLKATGGDPR